MTNPFDDAEGSFSVLVNDEGQHSLWPVFVNVPEGWTVVLEDRDRQTCSEYVAEHWTDMRPRSLAEQMDAAASPTTRHHGR